MAPSHLEFFKDLSSALSRSEFPALMFKPKQVVCWEQLWLGKDVIGVLPTGYGKSVLFQLLPYILPQKDKKDVNDNIVLVVCPLNSIIEDQIRFLCSIGIQCGTLRVRGSTQNKHSYKLFSNTDASTNSDSDSDIDFLLESVELSGSNSDNDEEEDNQQHLSEIITDRNIAQGKYRLLFGHPEAFLSTSGRQLLKSQTYQNRVVAITVDEAHCVQIW